MLVWDGDPVAFTLGPLVMRWYGLLFAGGFVLGYFMMTYMFKRARYNTDDLDRLLCYVFAGTIIGARLGHCLIYEPDFYLAHPLEILKIWNGGLASHGGTVGVVLAFFIFIRRSRKYRFFEIADMISVPIALVCTFIRLGNFMNSEILGKPTNSAFGIVFARIGENFARYPAMLFEAASYFVTFVVLSVLYFKWKRRPEGFLLGLLLFMIYTARFLIEPFKEEQADYSTGIALNVGQLLSIPFILGSLALMVLMVVLDKRRRARAAAADAAATAASAAASVREQGAGSGEQGPAAKTEAEGQVQAVKESGADSQEHS